MKGTRFICGLALSAMVVLCLVGCGQARPDGGSFSGILPGMHVGPAPWPAETANLKQRLSAIGLPALVQEGELLHIHQHLDIFVDGKPVQVPYGIGQGEKSSFMAPLHTHDKRGIIHVESPTDEVYTLGQFFDIWGVRLTADCIGGYCNSGDLKLRVYVNGSEFTGDPRSIKLEQHQEIYMAYGTADMIPDPVPSSFEFPEGL